MTNSELLFSQVFDASADTDSHSADSKASDVGSDGNLKDFINDDDEEN